MFGGSIPPLVHLRNEDNSCIGETPLLLPPPRGGRGGKTGRVEEEEYSLPNSNDINPTRLTPRHHTTSPEGGDVRDRIGCETHFSHLCPPEVHRTMYVQRDTCTLALAFTYITDIGYLTELYIYIYIYSYCFFRDGGLGIYLACL